MDYSFKDDVTVILHIGGSFMFPALYAHLYYLPWTRLEDETNRLTFFSFYFKKVSVFQSCLKKVDKPASH